MSIQGSINAILSSLERPALAKLAGKNVGREISSSIPEEIPQEKIQVSKPEKIAEIAGKISDVRKEIATSERKQSKKKVQEKERMLRGEMARQESKEGMYERWESLR